MTAGTRRVATAILRALWPKYGQEDFDDPDGQRWGRRLRETQQVIEAIYARAGITEPDTALLIAQMLDDEGHGAAAQLVRDLFPVGEDEQPPVPARARTVLEMHTGRMGAVITLKPREKSQR